MPQHAQFSIGFIDVPGCSQMTELEILDEGVVDLSFLFGTAGRPPLSEEQCSKYGYVDLGSQPLMVRLGKDAPDAGRSLMNCTVLQAYTLVTTDAPIFQSAEKAMKDILTSHHVDVSTLAGDVMSRDELVPLSASHAALLIGQSEIPASSGEWFVHMPFEETWMSIHMFAIYRLDNPNELVPLFAAAWSKGVDDMGLSTAASRSLSQAPLSL